ADLLAGLLLGNEIVNISIALTVSSIIHSYFSESTELTLFVSQVFLGTVLVIFIGDITPKIVASQNNVDFLRVTIPFIRLYLFLVFPARKLFTTVADLVVKTEKKVERFDEEDLVH